MQPPRTRVGARAKAAALVMVGLACFLAARRADAAPAWIYRGLTLPRGDVAVDVGLGYGHAPIDAARSYGGFGMNLELAGGVTHELELGFRTGVRFDFDGQVTQADSYGRPFETETYGAGGDRMANPELRLRWSVARGSAVQLGLDWRAYLPFDGTFGMMFGVPLTLRLGSVRFDTGLYVPIFFYHHHPTRTIVSIPLHIWIQATPRFWLGPLLGLRIVNDNHDEYPFGFGFGWDLGRAIDLRTWLLFPDMARNQAARWFGAGVALQLRFE